MTGHCSPERLSQRFTRQLKTCFFMKCIQGKWGFVFFWHRTSNSVMVDMMNNWQVCSNCDCDSVLECFFLSRHLFLGLLKGKTSIYCCIYIPLWPHISPPPTPSIHRHMQTRRQTADKKKLQSHSSSATGSIDVPSFPSFSEFCQLFELLVTIFHYLLHCFTYDFFFITFKYTALIYILIYILVKTTHSTWLKFPDMIFCPQTVKICSRCLLKQSVVLTVAQEDKHRHQPHSNI